MRGRSKSKDDDWQKKERIRRLVLSGMLAGTFVSLPLFHGEASAAVRTAEPVSDTLPAAAVRAQAQAALAMQKAPAKASKQASLETVSGVLQEKQQTMEAKPAAGKAAASAEQRAEQQEKLHLYCLQWLHFIFLFYRQH